MNSRHAMVLAGTPTGPALCARLAGMDERSVPDAQLMGLLSAHASQLAYQQARLWAVMAEIASRNPVQGVPEAINWSPEQVFDSAVEEVRAELRLTRRASRRELTHAEAVIALPAVAAALAAGRIDRARAIVLAEGCADLTGEQQQRLLAQVLPEAAAVTVTGLAERVRRVAIALDPLWSERRYREALHSRRVIGYLNDDGSATVSGQYLPADDAAAACARVDGLADAAKRAGAGAPIDHLRAELFLGLLDGRWQNQPESAVISALLQRFPPPADPMDEGSAELASSAASVEHAEATDRTAAVAASRGVVSRRIGVEVRVGLATMLGLDDQPGEIAGWGPVSAAVARDLVGRSRRAEWRFAVVDESGRLLSEGVTRARPTASGDQAPTRAEPERGAVVELHLGEGLLADPELALRCPAWARVIADLNRQRRLRRFSTQDPGARFPGRPLRRHSQIRHRTCVFPGCRRPARDCDQDHRDDHARGGPTTADNLAPGCRHDHDLKTRRGWRLARPTPDTYTWISPLGRRHRVILDPIAPRLPLPMPRRQRPPAEPEPPPSRAPAS